jgi:SAM-dependent methyltransferase
MFLYAVVAFINRFRSTRRFFNWIVEVIILIQSLLLWVNKKEYKTFSDCHFHFQKQAKHPWINERAIEYPWIAKNIAEIKKCRVLDVGAKEGLPSTDILLNNLNTVYTIDINTSKKTQIINNVIIEKGDIRSTTFETEFFDAVVVVSTLEHVGIPGRYGIEQSDDSGDFKAMSEIYRILKPGGRVLVTVPYGIGKSMPLNRLYTDVRIKKLFENFTLTKNEYFRFLTQYEMWFEVPEPIAAENNWDNEPWYALGCFYATKR